MGSSDRFFLGVIGLIAGSLLVLILGSMALSYYHTRKMAEMGYQETALPGTSNTIWRK